MPEYSTKNIDKILLSAKYRPIFNTPEELIMYVRKFDYGYIYNNEITNTDYDKYYRTIPPKKCMKYKVGTCWDLCNCLYYYLLKDFDIKCKYYYAEINTDDRKETMTHTFLGYYADDLFIIAEPTNGRMDGITRYNNEKEALDFVVEILLKYTPPKDNEWCLVDVNKYNLRKFNMTGEEMHEYFLTHGKCIRGNKEFYKNLLNKIII